MSFPRRARAGRAVVAVHPTSLESSREVAGEVAALIRERAAQGRSAVLGLATGTTPLGVYRELVRRHRKEGLSLHNVVTFNLDEYWPIAGDAPQSFRSFMRHHLFDHVDVPQSNIHLLDGATPRSQLLEACSDYERLIRETGGIDYQLLGIGRSGHIGFNEPGSRRDSRTRLVDLHQLTLADIVRSTGEGSFQGEESIPRHAITMGVATILSARRIVLLAFGKAKAEIVKRALRGAPSEAVPASFLREHRRACFTLDSEAASGLS